MAALRAILYVRVSKNDGDQDPETQLQALHRWVLARGWQSRMELVDRVTGDPARRGRNPPGLVQAIDLMKRRKADVLVIFAADRLVRSPTHLLQLVAQIQAAGGRVASLQDGVDLDTTSDMGELFVFLKGWMAKMELRLTRARTVAGLERAKADGKRLGRPQLKLPELAAVEALLADGVRGRAALAARLNCSPWAIRKRFSELAKKGVAISTSVQTESESTKQAGE